MITEYISLECLAATLNLPQNYLRDLVRKQKIPALKVNRRLRFDEAKVRQALAQIATEKPVQRKTIIFQRGEK